MRRRRRHLPSGAWGMHRIWERARERTRTLIAPGRGVPDVPAWPRGCAARGGCAGQPGRWDCSRLRAARALLKRLAAHHRADATLADMQRWVLARGRAGTPCFGHAPALQSISLGAVRGCCVPGAGPRGSSTRRPTTVTTGSVMRGNASAVTDWRHELQS